MLVLGGDGLPFLLDDDLLSDLLGVARAHIDRLDRSVLRPQVSWRSTSSPLVRARSHSEPQPEGGPTKRPG